MAHIEQGITWVAPTLKDTFTENVLHKFIWWWIIWTLNTIFDGNEVLITWIIFLYLLDLVLWISKSIKVWDFESSKAFKWATKILIYFIFLYMAVILDEWLHTGNFLLSTMFSFIVLSETTSILENLEVLWYKTPMFLKKHLRIHREKIDEELKKEERNK